MRGQIKHELVPPIHERRAELVAEGLNATTGQSVPAAVEAIVQAFLAKSQEERPGNAQSVFEVFVAYRGPLSPLSGTQAEPPARITPGSHNPHDATDSLLPQTALVPLRGLSGPL